MDYLPENLPVLFIPWVNHSVINNITSIFNDLNLGLIGDVKIKHTSNTKTQEQAFMVYVHFEEWFRNPTTDRVREKLISSPTAFVKIYYEPNKYFKVFADKRQSNTPGFKPTISFDDDEPSQNKTKYRLKPVSTRITPTASRFMPKSKPVPNSEDGPNMKKYKWKDSESDDET